MNFDDTIDMIDTPERYELEDEPFPHHQRIRTDLFRRYGNGIVILAAIAGSDVNAPDFDAWLHIGENSLVTLCSGKAEVGQNAKTSLAQNVADELGIQVASINVILGDTELTPFDMGTFGSRTTPIMVPQVRRAAATARELFIDLAAAHWKVDRNILTAKNGCIVKGDSGEPISYSQLAQGRKVTRISTSDQPTKPAIDWTIGGTSIPKTGSRAFVTGKHEYTSDIAVEGMLFGKILRPPAYRAVLHRVDIRRARELPGVIVVHEGSFVGVAAPTIAEAVRALAMIEAEWELPPDHPPVASQVSPADQYIPHSILARGSNGELQANAFSASHDSIGSVARTHNATYTLAYIAHVPLEPRAALAVWEDDKLTVWTGTQRPFGVREELMTIFGMAEDHVRVIVPDTGSGYGGKHTGDAAIEAARLARSAGRPVKIVWTREEEFTSAYLRPAGVIDVAAAIDNSDKIVGWDFHNYNSGGAGLQSPYDIPDQRAEFHETGSPFRQGSYRALAATGNHFARESHMDELARIAGMDPLAFRLHNLTDDRLRAVLEAAAERFGWSERKATEGHGFGIAGGTEKGSYIANCVEVEVDQETRAVRLVRIVAAYECGAVINPMHLENQIEGAIVMGIGGALYEAIRFEGSKILNPRLSEYRVPRFGDVPEIDIVLLNRKDIPSIGAGETPIVAIAPAIGNAICDATGIRPRSLPMQPFNQN